MTALLVALALTGHHHGCQTVRCQHRVDYHQRRHRRYLVNRMPTAVASWYEDAGATACGTHYALGFASRTLPCGQRVRFCRTDRHCATGTVQDRGPFIAGRLFDFNAGLKAATGCTDLCTVHYRLR